MFDKIDLKQFIEESDHSNSGGDIMMLRRAKMLSINWFKHLSINKKMSYLYIPLTILPMIVFAFFSMHSYENIIINRSLETMEDNSVLISDRVEGILNEAESAATYLTININNLVNRAEYEGKLSDDVKLYNLISNELAYAKLIYKEIDSIVFLDRRSTLYYSDVDLQKNAIKAYNSEMIRELEQTAGQSIWFDMSYRDFLVKNPNVPIVTLGKKVWNINTGETIGYLIINISESCISDIFVNQLQRYEIINRQGMRVSVSESSKLMTQVRDSAYAAFIEGGQSSAQITSDASVKEMVAKEDIPYLGWVLFAVAELDVLTADLANLLILSGLLLFMIITLEISMSLVLNNLITSPIIKLKQGVEELGRGNFDFRFKMKTKDEIGLFARSFNRMSEEIRTLLDQVEIEERKKREYEMALIQEQIKPHFLYNSLDIIMKLSQMGQNKKAQRSIMRLADYYRRSLSDGADQITIKDELELTKDYLELQKIRYGDMFTYTIEVPDEVEEGYIPKLTLQPIVENAIYHGIKYLENERGHIEIRGAMTEGMHTIYVKDNGVGMTNNQLERVSSFSMTNHFGLKNVNSRLQLFYGKKYGLILTSVHRESTTVEIRLPGGRIND